MRLMMTAACLLLPVTSFAQTIYTWTDETGTAHFTDTLSSVPQGVKVETTEGAELALVSTDDPAEAPPVSPRAVAAQRQPAPAPAADPSDELDEIYWRGQFRQAHKAVQNLEDELTIDKRRLEEPSGVAIRYQCGGYVHPLQGNGYRPTDPVANVVGGVNVQAAPGVTVSGTVQTTPNYRNQYGGPCLVTPSPDYERLRSRVDRNTLALERAKTALNDLDRLASQKGVPREWRRP